jgi:transcriptional regulator with XRE-family HTH domain
MISERNIKIIGEHLRAGREAQGRSLDDIATATRINLQFLDELENGTGPKLPMTYIDAFVKDYAKEIGLDLNELFEKVGETVTSAEIQQSPSPSGYKKADIPEVEFKPAQKEFPFSMPHHVRLLIIIIAIVVVGLMVMLLIIGNGKKSEPPVEISFSEAVNQEELRLRQNIAGKDTTDKIDTLIFEGTARDTVWVKVITDGKDTSELILPPFTTHKWFAAESLQVSLGNALAMIFKLNGKELGTLGPSRRSLRNVVISRAMLKLDAKKGAVQ